MVMVESLLPLLLTIAGSVAVGVVAGMVFERTNGVAAKRAARFEADLVQARSDLVRHQEETARHFGKSADLLGRMATNYREFLDHFVSGAEELCGGRMKEIAVDGLERPLLDTTSAASTPPPPVRQMPPPTDTEPLAEDATK
jgi:uncharacterized membrane-anchored protein YhcB (DUF1043 family)